MEVGVAHVGIWCYALPPPRDCRLIHEDRVGRAGPLAARSLRSRPREEKGRIRELDEKTVRLVDDCPENRDRTGRVVVAYIIQFYITGIRRA
jgi:hypothetical protein